MDCSNKSESNRSGNYFGIDAIFQWMRLECKGFWMQTWFNWKNYEGLILTDLREALHIFRYSVQDVLFENRNMTLNEIMADFGENNAINPTW